LWNRVLDRHRKTGKYVCTRYGDRVEKGRVMTITDLPPHAERRAGELLGISRRSAYRAAAAGELPTFKLGRRLLVPTARLLDLLGLGDSEPFGSTVAAEA
jgi:excisionase family DNA binding protein